MTLEQIDTFLSQLTNEQLIARASEARHDLRLARIENPGSEWQKECERALFAYTTELFRRDALKDEWPTT